MKSGSTVCFLNEPIINNEPGSMLIIFAYVDFLLRKKRDRKNLMYKANFKMEFIFHWKKNMKKNRHLNGNSSIFMHWIGMMLLSWSVISFENPMFRQNILELSDFGRCKINLMPKKESESSIFNEITRVIEMVIAYFRHHPATTINLYANEMHTCGFCAGSVWITIILTLDSYFAGIPRLLLLL